MNRTPQLIGALTGIQQRAAQRLDGLGDFLPAQKPAISFDDYMAQARAVAEADPAFRQEFERALAQYRAAGGI